MMTRVAGLTTAPEELPLLRCGIGHRHGLHVPPCHERAGDHSLTPARSLRCRNSSLVNISSSHDPVRDRMALSQSVLPSEVGGGNKPFASGTVLGNPTAILRPGDEGWHHERYRLPQSRLRVG